MNYFPSQIQFEPHNKLSSFNKNLMAVLGVVTDIINQTPQVIDAEDEVGIGTKRTSFSSNRLSCIPKELGDDKLTRFWRRNGNDNHPDASQPSKKENDQAAMLMSSFNV